MQIIFVDIAALCEKILFFWVRDSNLALLVKAVFVDVLFSNPNVSSVLQNQRRRKMYRREDGQRSSWEIDAGVATRYSTTFRYEYYKELQ